MKSLKKWKMCQRSLFSMFVLVLLSMAVGSNGAAMNSTSFGRVNQFAGTWEGTFETNEFPGNMKLVLKNEGEKLSGTLEISVGIDTASGPLLDIECDGNNLSCRFTGTGPDVLIKGKVDEDKMTGSLSVYSGEDLIDEGTFQCTRK